MIDDEATVVQRLDEAGAVLVAKLTMGALAWGESGSAGQTRNPWNLGQGSSGSSAGSAAATAAGLVGFAIGSETWGSIVSPATRCGVTGLRPTFGRVSRHGAWRCAGAWTRSARSAARLEDCALVFAAITAPTATTARVVDVPFAWQRRASAWANLRIGYVESDFADGARTTRPTTTRRLAVLRWLGANLIPIELPEYPIEAISFILSAEAAAAFDELTRSNRDDLLARQAQDAWPNVFRQARLIPAVEYIQANRLRTLLMRAMDG